MGLYGSSQREALNGLMKAVKAPAKKFKSTFETGTRTPEARLVQQAVKATRKGRPVNMGKMRFR